MANPTNEELAEALRSIEGLPLGMQLIVRLAADRLSPEVGEWITWVGGECPVPMGTYIFIRHRDGNEYLDHAGGPWSYDWTHTSVNGDIIAYRIVK